MLLLSSCTVECIVPQISSHGQYPIAAYRQLTLQSQPVCFLGCPEADYAQLQRDRVLQCNRLLAHPDVKGLCPPGQLRSIFNDVALCDCQRCRISRPYRDAQDWLL